ncbi:uncharacterized protein LOC107304988 [Oryza brachyantha]|uniref:uncharacterized protein LOC107304988 n=1 Tax=Oryza brachyantha TaxID=4533 RepID=UPI0007769800|nr:uncharacterized protein LOC107304988 [Oryza brachyantha]
MSCRTQLHSCKIFLSISIHLSQQPRYFNMEVSPSVLLPGDLLRSNKKYLEVQPPFMPHHPRPPAMPASIQQLPLTNPHLPQLTPDVESALLQQVLQLTPEQLSLLPVEQQQQVIQLQKMLSAGK